LQKCCSETFCDNLSDCASKVEGGGLYVCSEAGSSDSSDGDIFKAGEKM
jgi:hypothetical protein